MTLQESKEEVAKKWSYVDWEICMNDQPSYKIEMLMDDVAELYARSKFEQGAKEQLILANQHCMKLHHHVLLETPKPEFNP